MVVSYVMTKCNHQKKVLGVTRGTLSDTLGTHDPVYIEFVLGIRRKKYVTCNTVKVSMPSSCSIALGVCLQALVGEL